MNYYNEFIQHKAFTHQGTLRNYKPILSKFNQAFTDLKQLEEKNLLEYLNELKKTRPIKSMRYEAMVIQSYLRYWYDRRIVSFPAKISTGRIPHNPHHATTEEEYKKIENLDFPETFKGLRNLVIVRLLWETGMRISELLGLRYEQIDLSDKSAKIPTKKNERIRWVFWSEDTNIHLENYLACAGCSYGEKIIKVSVRTVERIFRNLCSQAGVASHLVPHSMRHGKAHRILKLGGTLKDIQDTLGHSTIESSMRYLNLTKEEKQERAKMYF